MALDEDEKDCLPEPWAARLAMERVTRVFSVRIREVVVIECIAEDKRRCENTKQKVIQERHLELEERLASSLRVASLDLTQSAESIGMDQRSTHCTCICVRYSPDSILHSTLGLHRPHSLYYPISHLPNHAGSSYITPSIHHHFTVCMHSCINISCLLLVNTMR